jgi:hypothetical protein
MVSSFSSGPYLTGTNLPRRCPSQPIPLGRFLMQQPPALAAFLNAHEQPLIGEARRVTPSPKRRSPAWSSAPAPMAAA